jgi:hypothetical protein
MDFKSNQFTIFAICLIILITISFLAHHLIKFIFYKDDGSNEYRSVNLGNASAVNSSDSINDNQTGIQYSGKLNAETGSVRRNNVVNGPVNSVVRNNPVRVVNSAQNSSSGRKNKKCKNKRASQRQTNNDDTIVAAPESGPGTVQYDNPGNKLDGSVYNKSYGPLRDARGNLIQPGLMPGQLPGQVPGQLPGQVPGQGVQYDSVGNYIGTNSQSVLGQSDYSRVTSGPSSFATTLPNSANLGKIRVSSDILVGQTENIRFDTNQTTLTVGMQLVIGTDSVTIVNVNVETNWFSSSQYNVTIDTPSPIFVAADTYLTVLSPINSGSAGPDDSSSGDYSVYVTPTPSGLNYGTNPDGTPATAPSYVLHLPASTNTNNVLIITPSLNVTSDTLSLIANLATTTNEPAIASESFVNKKVVEGLETTVTTTTPTPTPTTTTSSMDSSSTTSTTTTSINSGPAPVSDNRKSVTCGPKSSSAVSSESNLSIFYVSDCVGYHIKWISYKLDTLLIKLDTPDEIMLHTGYYKLAI